ncbi:hypothetical protein TNCV_2237101 [Trichonephila clavipes]|nr:hypothetical protein TNCV_2237101 [Trichonephila clavipes]
MQKSNSVKSPCESLEILKKTHRNDSSTKGSLHLSMAENEMEGTSFCGFRSSDQKCDDEATDGPKATEGVSSIRQRGTLSNETHSTTGRVGEYVRSEECGLLRGIKARSLIDMFATIDIEYILNGDNVRVNLTEIVQDYLESHGFGENGKVISASRQESDRGNLLLT